MKCFKRRRPLRVSWPASLYYDFAYGRTNSGESAVPDRGAAVFRIASNGDDGVRAPRLSFSSDLGVVRGIVVRSRNIFANIGASLQTIVGGNIKAWSQLCEQTRADSFDIMIQHASELGANGIVGARYDANEIGSNATEVPAYGTAVIV